MCSLSCCFGPSLSGTRPALCFVCSHVFLFWSRLNWDTLHPLLSLLSCDFTLVVLAPAYLGPACFLFSHFFCFGLGLTGTQPTLFFLCSQVLFFCFGPPYLGPSPPSVFFFLLCSLSVRYGPGLTGTHPTLFFLCSHVLFFCFGPPYLGPSPPSVYFALMFSLSTRFGPGLTGTRPTLFFLCSHVLFFLLIRHIYDSAQPLFSLLSCVFFPFALVPAFLGPAPTSASSPLMCFLYALVPA